MQKCAGLSVTVKNEEGAELALLSVLVKRSAPVNGIRVPTDLEIVVGEPERSTRDAEDEYTSGN